MDTTQDVAYIRVEDVFILDNGDGTFSLYIDGLFAAYADETMPHFRYTPLRQRVDE